MFFNLALGIGVTTFTILIVAVYIKQKMIVSKAYEGYIGIK